MSKFKIGDEVWFFYIDSNRCWGDNVAIIFPSKIEIVFGQIVYMNENRDCVHVYVEGVIDVVNFGYTFHENYFYASHQDAHTGMTEALHNL